MARRRRGHAAQSTSDHISPKDSSPTRATTPDPVMIKVSGISLSLSPSEVRERIARRLLLTESPGFERSLSDHRLPGRGGQGELGQGCPQPWKEGSSPSRNSHSRDPRAAGKKARRGRCRPPRWRRGTGHATTIAGADGSTHPLRRKWTGDCFHGFAEPDDDTGRLSASSELLQFAGSWRHPATMLDFLTPGYSPRIAG